MNDTTTRPEIDEQTREELTPPCTHEVERRRVCDEAARWAVRIAHDCIDKRRTGTHLLCTQHKDVWLSTRIGGCRRCHVARTEVVRVEAL